MTITALVRGRYPATLSQYAIFERADRILPAGRYYGGPLTDTQVEFLTEGLKPNDMAPTGPTTDS